MSPQCNSCGGWYNVNQCDKCFTLICERCRMNHDNGCQQAQQMRAVGLGATVRRVPPPEPELPIVVPAAPVETLSEIVIPLAANEPIIEVRSASASIEPVVIPGPPVDSLIIDAEALKQAGFSVSIAQVDASPTAVVEPDPEPTV